jgi:hypothetical protein
MVLWSSKDSSKGQECHQNDLLPDLRRVDVFCLHKSQSASLVHHFHFTRNHKAKTMSPFPMTQDQSGNSSLENNTVSSLKASMFSTACPDSLSLNSMMINPKTFSAAHSALVRDYTRQIDKPKKLCFDVVDYGYGDTEEVPVSKPPSKRRRYERRNSKTPAMLMAMNAALSLEFMAEHDESERDSSHSSDDGWDGGIEIAEELVKQLQNRRRSGSS